MNGYNIGFGGETNREYEDMLEMTILKSENSIGFGEEIRILAM